MKIKQKLLAFFAAISLSATIIYGQNTGVSKIEQISVSTTESSIVKLTDELLDVFKRGNRDEIVRYVKERLDPAMTEMSSEESVINHIFKIAQQSGGFEILETNFPKENEMQILVRAIRGGEKARIRAFLNKRKNQLKGFDFELLPTEAEMRVKQWSKLKMSEADAISTIDKSAAELEKIDKLSGVLLIAKKDKILFHQSYGHSIWSSRKPNQKNTLFPTASMSKMFTAIAIAQLIERGKLSLDDTLEKVLPGYPDKETAAKIKIRHLLSHQSGLGNVFNEEYKKNPGSYVRPSDYFPLFAGKRLFFEPGTKWSYSNTGMIVLGAVVEQISGKKFEDYLSDNIFKPAGMKNTFYDSAAAPKNRLASLHSRFSSNDPLKIEPRQENSNLGIASPAGNFFTTAEDMLKFIRALQNGKLVKQEILIQFTTAGSKTSPNPRYAFGFETFSYNGKPGYGHSGGAPGVNTNALTFADGTYTVVILTNYDPGFAQNFARDIFAFMANVSETERK
jgi:CubicO group peptidase (beta-lactamase class C family)